MDGMKRRKKSFEFAEGHKRETRKSYQSFIESTGKSWPSVLANTVNNKAADGVTPFLSNIKSEDLADDGIRKSSRKPVPKKSFELVDVFEKKSPLVKHYSGNQKGIMPVQGHMFEVGLVSIKQEPIDDDFDLAPRKSNRVPVPKKSFDLIDPKLREGMVVNEQDNIKTNMEAKGQKKSKNSRAEKTNIVNSEAEAKFSDGEFKKMQFGKRGKRVENLAASLSDKQKQDFEKREKSKFTLKLDFKARRDKGSRKRKLTTGTDITSPCQNSDVLGAEEPSEKIAKIVEDNIDKLAAVEALQALKQPHGHCPMEESDQIISEKKKSLMESEEIDQKLIDRKSPLKKVLSGDKSTIQKTPKVIEEEESEKATYGKLSSSEKGWDYSRSTTEISDGHVILKLGGLNSPTKMKKHKKKHKHGHHNHKAEVQEEELNKGNDGLLLDDTNLLDKSENVECKSITPGGEDTSNKKIKILDESKEKKGKDHKKKRKVSQSKMQESAEKDVLGTKPEENELTIKKRKIYKKKKGQKILVRIQTEFWNKSGKLVKVEPTDIKEGKPNQAKDKKDIKQKKLQTALSDEAIPGEELNTHSTKHTGLSGSDMKTDTKEDQELKPKAKSKPKKLLTSSIADAKKSAPKMTGNKAKSNTNTKKGVDGISKKKKERKTQTLTAYLLYCRKYRSKVVHENPEIGFSEISKKLAQMWNEAPEKEKDIYKKQLEEHRAKVNASIRKGTSKKLKTTKQNGQAGLNKCEKAQYNPGRMSSREYQIAPQKYSVGNLEPLDMGAHLQLLGESLMLVGTALRRQVLSKSSDLKVYGSLSVLLDSSLCAMAPLLFLTSCVPQLDVIPSAMKANTLDNIAYILPGL